MLPAANLLTPPGDSPIAPGGDVTRLLAPGG